ncbi:MAG: LemA family protein [candidate division NC10 bacterium]|nr:LemA family protein [candidate division NC10 bacterium]
MIEWVVGGVLAAVILWVILTFNGLVRLKNRVQNAWQQIDVQLKRRHDLIPNLVNAVRGAMQFERDTLERVIAARTPGEAGAAEGELTAAVGRLFALMENYPDLKSNRNVLQLQEELTSTENRVGFARQLYNDLVVQFNTRQEVFPANLLAARMGFRAADYFQAEAAARAVPTVDLTLR